MNIRLLRTLHTIQHIGILNFILLLVAPFGIIACIGTFVGVKATSPTASDIADSKKEAIPFESLTEKGLQEGTMVEGRILFNMGHFADRVYANDSKHSYTAYVILLDDKVMSVAIEDAKARTSLERQALNYKLALDQNDLNIWQYHAEDDNSKNKKKKSKKNQKTVKQVIEENMKYTAGVDFRGKVVKLDSATEEALKNYVTPEGETEPAFEIIPYEIKSVEPVNMGELILAYALIALIGIVGVAALYIFILRMRAHKFFP